jgi:hypothetical protein
VNYLLDVNILVAWGWTDHVAHDRTSRWIADTRRQGASQLLTSAIPQLGFVRVSVQRTGGGVTVDEAARTLAGMLRSLGPAHTFVPDDRAARQFSAWCRHATQTTDAHLMQLAAAHDAELATLDAGIPGAFLLPGVDAAN